MRLFIAVHFSSEVKKVLLDTIERMKELAVSGNFTRPENLHLTLAFIGETNNVAAVRQIIDQSAVPSFEMKVGGFGRFGRLYWVGIEENPALASLAESLRNGLRAAGFPMEERAFRPHITLAREIVTDGPLHIPVPKTAMTADRVSLMKSERIGGRLTYTEIYGKTLRP